MKHCLKMYVITMVIAIIITIGIVILAIRANGDVTWEEIEPHVVNWINLITNVTTFYLDGAIAIALYEYRNW